MTNLNVPDEVVSCAWEKLRAIPHDTWPEDIWVSLGPEWDLNIWLDKTIKPYVQRATIYPVYEGRVDTEVGYRIL